MAEKVKDMWLKVLIGFIFSLIVLVTSLGANKLDKKVDKTVFDMHERYQSKQFDSIKTYQKEQFDGIKAYQKERFDDFKNALDDMKVK